jgi:competence protein ComEC
MFISTRIIGSFLLLLGIGIGIGSTIEWFYPLMYGLLFVGGISLVVGTHMRLRAFILVALFLAFLALGVLRGATVSPVRTESLDTLVDTKTQMSGTIIRDPDRRTSSTHYVLRFHGNDRDDQNEESLILVRLPRYPEYAVGDALTLDGTLRLPKDFETDPSRPPFSYVRYLAKDGIGYVMQDPTVVSVEATGESSLLRALSIWKGKILEKGKEIFSEPQGGLIAGMLVGERHAMPKDILDDMRVAGLVHIIVVSGYNMTVVAEAVSNIFRALPIVLRSGIGILLIWVYAGMVAGGAPVIRAAIMTSLALLARMTGSTAIALRLLYLSGIVMILQNPRIVLDDASFHLSFLATLGLIVLSPRIDRFFTRGKAQKGKVDTRVWWRELFSSTLSAQLMVIPYILFFSGQLSPYALPANLLALPFVPLTMGLGTLALLCSAVVPFVGPIVGWIASIPATWILAVGGWFAGLPGSGAILPIPFSVMLLLYAIGGGIFLWFRKRDGIDIAKEETDDDEREESDTDSVPSEDVKTFPEGISEKDERRSPNRR